IQKVLAVPIGRIDEKSRREIIVLEDGRESDRADGKERLPEDQPVQQNEEQHTAGETDQYGFKDGEQPPPIPAPLRVKAKSEEQVKDEDGRFFGLEKNEDQRAQDA